MSMKVSRSKPTGTAKTPERTAGTVPTPSDPAHPLLALRQEIDTLFDTFFSNFSLGPFGRRRFDLEPFRRVEEAFTSFGSPTPRTDFTETDKQFRVSAELPGMDENDIEVTLSDDNLVIKGEKKEEKVEKKEDYRLTERHYGSFRRTFRVPQSVDQEKVEASFKKGVLEIIMPKKPAAVGSAKKIKIKGK